MDPAILIPAIVIVLFMILVAVGIFYLMQLRHIERMAEIEHGLVDEERRGRRFVPNFAILCIFLGLGMFASYFLVSFFDFFPLKAFIPCLLLFGGLGMFISHLISQRGRD